MGGLCAWLEAQVRVPMKPDGGGWFSLWTLPKACRGAGRCPIGVPDVTQYRKVSEGGWEVYRERLLLYIKLSDRSDREIAAATRGDDVASSKNKGGWEMRFKVGWMEAGK